MRTSLLTIWRGSVYGIAEDEGVIAGKSQVAAYADDCPDAKLVFSGHSLGAHVWAICRPATVAPSRCMKW